MSQEDFIKKVKSVYGDFFDCSKVEFRGMRERITISSEKFGEESVIPSNLFCYNFMNRKWRDGDIKGVSRTRSYRTWYSIKVRCNPKTRKKKDIAYSECVICEEWRDFNNFKSWYDRNYVPGYQIDKDIIKKGNKTYCPEFCCFVPQEINLLTATRGIRATKYPPGVNKTKSGKFEAYITIKKKRIHIGTYDSMDLAFAIYKKEKEAHIQKVAQEYYDANKIERRVYDALMNYEVQITD